MWFSSTRYPLCPFFSPVTSCHTTKYYIIDTCSTFPSGLTPNCPVLPPTVVVWVTSQVILLSDRQILYRSTGYPESLYPCSTLSFVLSIRQIRTLWNLRSRFFNLKLVSILYWFLKTPTDSKRKFLSWNRRRTSHLTFPLVPPSFWSIHRQRW